MSDGIWRWIKVAIDKGSLQKVESDAKEALDKGTDPKKPEANLRKVEGSMERLRKVALRVGAVLATMFGARAIGRFLGESLRAGQELERSRNMLRLAVENEGTAWAQVEGEISRVTRVMWEQYRLTEAEFNPMLQALVQTTGDYENSLRAVGIAANLAAATGLDNVQAARLLGRVLNGERTALRRYGIEVGEGADAVQALSDRLEGMAAASKTSTQQLADSWGNLKEEIGLILMQGGDTEGLFGRLKVLVDGLTDSLNRNRDRFAGWVRVFADGVALVGRAVGFVLRGVVMAVEATGAAFALMWDGVPVLAQRAMNRVQRIVVATMERLATPLRAIGVDVGRAWSEGLIEELDRADAALQRRGQQIADAFRDVLADIGRGPASTGGGSGGLGLGMPEVRPRGGGGEGETGRDLQRRTADLQLATATWRDLNADYWRSQRIQVGQAAPLWSGMFEAIERRQREHAERMRRNAETVAWDMTRAFQPFWEGLLLGFQGAETVMDGFRQAAQGVGAAVVSALTEGYAEYHMAQGAGKLAEGTWPPNPAALAAAAKHFAAAAAFRAIPAVIGGTASAGRGIASGSMAATMTRGGEPERAGPDINIYIDGVDPSNPRHQQMIGETSRQWQERTGGNVRYQSRR
jgi:hypothetical protein